MISQVEMDRIRQFSRQVDLVDSSKVLALLDETEKLAKKMKEIRSYCAKHSQFMWAATILGVIYEKDFRDAATEARREYGTTDKIST